MWFRVAALLHCSVREAQASMDAAEFREWCAVYKMDPWGEERADLRNGIVCSVLANVWSGKNARKATPQDFMPFVKRKARPGHISGVGNMAAFAKAFAARHGTVKG
jgi:hypothetical protein